MSTHFVAHLKIEKIDVRETRPDGNKRDISEVTQLTIKSDTLEGLTDKLAKHIAIIEED